MAEHLWSVLCTRAVIDKFTNQVSLFDVLEQIKITLEEPDMGPDGYAEHKPAFKHTFQVVSLWRRTKPDEPEIGRCRIGVQAPRDPQSDARVEVQITLDTHLRTRTVMSILALPYRGPGTYFVLIEQDDGDAWTLTARLPLEVEVIEMDAEIPVDQAS